MENHERWMGIIFSSHFAHLRVKASALNARRWYVFSFSGAHDNTRSAPITAPRGTAGGGGGWAPPAMFIIFVNWQFWQPGSPDFILFRFHVDLLQRATRHKLTWYMHSSSRSISICDEIRSVFKQHAKHAESWRLV